DRFEADGAARRRHTHIVAPPGSGKTIMGLEIARRIGQPALVLCPTTAFQAQWAARDAGVPLTALRR
ncbi:MAG TPA: DEAD/DEAH box helicase family protein, partial [Solirubrobacteraceae bacterium]|nr:DEAD/DEAH box helicase family protein [Solirubrobacteraceae bacterium]